MPKNSIKAVLFDMDGVLVDARPWHFQSFNKALNLFGLGMTEKEHEDKYDGLPTHTKLEMLNKEGKVPTSLNPIIRKLKSEYTSRMIEEHCRPSYDKILMLNWLKNKGLKLACCSNATTESVNVMLKKSHIDKYFNIICGNTSGFDPKPSPEIYIETMKMLRVAPEQTLIIEDSPHGIKAAKDSGAHVIEVVGYTDVNSALFFKYFS